MRAVLYIRVSTGEQAREGYSLAAQERALRDYAALRGYEVVKVYHDDGITAKDVTGRPALQELLASLASGLCGCVLVWKLTRLTRSLSDLCRICDALDAHNVTLISVTEAFDCSTPAGRMTLNVLGSIAQFEREVIAENVKMALAERASQGKRTFSRILGYDIVDDVVTVNEPEAETVRRAVSLYLKNKSLSETARQLNAEGWVGKNGNLFSPNTVRTILTNFSYCGYYPYCGEPIPADFEPILDKATYNRVQRLIAKNPKGRKRTRELVLL